jgi:endonuclease/exonuclease/phosphatase (EEP) superfamily protein YafD
MTLRERLKSWLSSLLWLSTLPLIIYTLLCYLLSYSLFFEHWVAQFMMMSLPVALLLLFCVALLWLWIRPARAMLPSLILLIGIPFINRTITFSSEGRTKNPINVLTYNVYGFWSSEYPAKKSQNQDQVEWLANLDADVKCLQEFYNWDEMKDFRTIKKLTENTPNFVVTPSENTKKVNQGMLGLAIFTKYKILKHGGKFFKNSEENGYLWADVLRNEDTLRIINVHFCSMGIRVNNVLKEVRQKDYAEAKQEGKSVIERLKNGFEKRIKQVKVVTELIDESPYPVILCGDFNEMPYGHAYGRIRDRLHSSYEEGGNGFGFTLNRSPFWIRIDNQFYSGPIQLVKFKTHSDIKFSDHLPVSASYCWE